MDLVGISSLEIRILLKLAKKNLSKRDITQIFWKVSKTVRNEALNHLILKGYIIVFALPKPGVKKTPTYYQLSKIGMRWVQNYLKELP